MVQFHARDEADAITVARYLRISERGAGAERGTRTRLPRGGQDKRQGRYRFIQQRQDLRQAVAGRPADVPDGVCNGWRAFLAASSGPDGAEALDGEQRDQTQVRKSVCCV